MDGRDQNTNRVRLKREVAEGKSGASGSADIGARETFMRVVLFGETLWATRRIRAPFSTHFPHPC